MPVLDERRTTGDFLTYWVGEVLPGTVAASTLQGYRHIVRRDVVPYVGDVPLAQLGPQHVHVMLRALEKRGLSPRTVAYARAVLRRALGHAQRWELVHRNAAALVDAPRQRRRESDHLSKAEVQALLAAAATDPLEALWVVAVTTGLRRGEVLGLRWCDLDLEAGVLHVRTALKRITGQGLVREEPKTARSRRTVPLPALTVAVLRRHRLRQREDRLASGLTWPDDGPVFATVIGTPLDERNLTRAFHEVCERAGLGRRRFHALRHSAATLMLTEGVPLAVIARTLGHSGIQITADLYAAVVPELQRDAAAALQRALGN